MLPEISQEEKKFFADNAWGASKLSTCTIRRGASLIRGNRIISTGYNRLIIKDKKWEISAIYDAVFSARDLDLTGTSLFSTHFPNTNDVILLISVGVSTLYFFGGTNDHSAVELINNLTGASILLEIIHLE
jgi:hypothetical protein